MNEYALITGASKGIGKSMALLLAQKGYNLLVARSEAELNASLLSAPCLMNFRKTHASGYY